MNQILIYAGNAGGILGSLICLMAGLTRLSGSFYFANYEATTLFMVGVGLMVFACMVKLEVLLKRT
jgi:hypothetical protein